MDFQPPLCMYSAGKYIVILYSDIKTILNCRYFYDNIANYYDLNILETFVLFCDGQDS